MSEGLLAISQGDLTSNVLVEYRKVKEAYELYVILMSYRLVMTFWRTNIKVFIAKWTHALKCTRQSSKLMKIFHHLQLHTKANLLLTRTP